MNGCIHIIRPGRNAVPDPSDHFGPLLDNGVRPVMCQKPAADGRLFCPAHLRTQLMTTKRERRPKSTSTERLA